MENRMIELETKCSYLEHMVQELNEVVTRQQGQIDSLEKTMQQLRDYMRTIEAPQSRPEQEAPPPHY